MSQAAAIEERLSAHTLPGLAQALPPGEFAMPHYHGLGLANLPATIAALLGARLRGACPPLQRDLWADWQSGIQRVILVVIDALGYRQLRAAMAADEELVFHRLAEAGRMVPLTSTFPSTTNTVLTTLWTGRSPAAHGVLAYELYLRELGVAASALFFWPVHHRQRDELGEWGVEAEEFVPVPGLAEILAAQGITTRSLVSKAYANSLLSRIHRRGVEQVTGFVAGGDMWLGIQRTIAEHADEKLLLVAYWDTIDGITHQYGPDDDAWTIELRGLSWMMEQGLLSRLTPEQREGTLLLVTADHGGVSTSREAGVPLDDHPALRDALALPPLGESRTPFWYTRGGALGEVRSYLDERLGSSFATLTREQALESGLLGPGPMYAETPHRLGDLISLARGSSYLATSNKALKMRGRHGGLSQDEMWVPLLGVRLDAL
jgi:hypothetical protein